MQAPARHRMLVADLLLALGRGRFRQTPDYPVGDQSVAGGVEMYVSENVEAQIPASGLDPRALIFHGKEGRKQRYETLALFLAPLAPDAYFRGVRRVVRDLGREGVNDDAGGYISLLQLLPKEIHF